MKNALAVNDQSCGLSGTLKQETRSAGRCCHSADTLGDPENAGCSSVWMCAYCRRWDTHFHGWWPEKLIWLQTTITFYGQEHSILWCSRKWFGSQPWKG
ncbi:uncharacterized protein LOC107435791 isoform X6 [Ziziphus jujuba]|uniref:Uncharacterized protein LOC107435791 isoform X6 n=1 Tax=Ziziphus jujuba TaxID=326968 RepID=A0ABM3I055_ZIZJJ|nr:uncharacterized protein LOC107435791 isoform X6 [Ziziphus jujuba]